MTELPESAAADDASCRAFLHDELDFDELSRRNFVVVIDLSTCACSGVVNMNAGVDSCDLITSLSSSPSSSSLSQSPSSPSSPSPSSASSASSSSSASSALSSCHRCDALTRCWRLLLQIARGGNGHGNSNGNGNDDGDAGPALTVASMSDCCFHQCVPLMENDDDE